MTLMGKGVNGQLEVDDTWITIRRQGLQALALDGGRRGERRIPLANVTSVELKKPGATRGYIRFSVPGAVETRGAVRAATADDNAVLFSRRHAEEFYAIRAHV